MTETVDEKTGEVTPTGKPTGQPRIGRKITHPDCGPGIAKQEFKKECDINNIMEKYKATGLMPQQVNAVQENFANFQGVDDYYTACSKAAAAQQEFDKLPSKMRKIFDNDPGKLVSFVTNPKNQVAAARMGLLTKEATKKVYQAAMEAKQKADQKIVDKAEARKVQKPGPKEAE